MSGFKPAAGFPRPERAPGVAVFAAPSSKGWCAPSKSSAHGGARIIKILYSLTGVVKAMARHQRTRSLALALGLLVSSTAAPAVVLAQKDKGKGKQQQDVPDRERNVKKERSNMFKKWIEEDVTYIITDDEKKAWKKLATDEEREQFIEQFWRRRDPDPDTEVNEYLEEHYERVAYANQHFTSGIPGWKTDRGRIYLMYGPPNEKETHPSGGEYDRPSYEGGGSA